MKNKLIKQFIKEGGSISLSVKNDNLYYVVDTGMKSNLSFRFTKGNECHIITRYQEFTDEITSVEDILRNIYYNCMCGRDYMNLSIKEMLIKYGFIDRKDETK